MAEQILAENSCLQNLKTSSDSQKCESTITIIAFFVFGFLIYFAYSLIIAGTQDILAGTFVQTSVVLMCNIGPFFAVTLVAPYFIQKVQYVYRVIILFLLEVVGLLTVVFAKGVEFKLCGVCLCSLGLGLGELSFMAMSSHYNDVVVNCFSAGTGVGVSLAPLYYTAMTLWACISPGMTIAIVTILMILILIFYFVMDKNFSSDLRNATSSCTDIVYKKLESEVDHSPERCQSDSKEHTSFQASSGEPKEESFTWREKFRAMREILPIAGSVTVAWIAEYLIIQAVITTIAFTNAPFPPRDHYQYYIFTFLGGELFGRSYLVLATSIKPELAVKLVIHRLWILATIEWLHLVFFGFVAWYRFIHSVSLVLVLAFTAGIVIGVMYSNMLALYSQISDPTVREFTLGYASVATGTGAFTAGLLGLIIEPWLRSHCLGVAKSRDYCLTRSINRGLNACAHKKL